MSANISTLLQRFLLNQKTEWRNMYDLKKSFDDYRIEKYKEQNLSSIFSKIDYPYYSSKRNSSLYRFAGFLGSSTNSNDNQSRIIPDNIESIESQYYRHVSFKKNLNDSKNRLDQLKFLIESGYLSMCVEKNIDNTAEWMIDLSFMENCEVKNRYHVYGGVLKFDIDNNESNSAKIVVRSLRYNGSTLSPSEKEFDKCLNIFLSSGFVYTTIALHALLTHVIVSCGAFKAFTELKNSKSNLARFIYYFTYNSPDTAYKAQTILLRRGGMLRKLFAFTNTGFDNLVRYSNSKISVQDTIDMITKNSSFKQLPIVTKLNMWFEVINEFCANVGSDIQKSTDPEDIDRFIKSFNKNVKTENTTLASTLNILVFFATIYHAVVGNIMYYHGDPKFLNMKVSFGGEKFKYPTIQEYHMLMVLTSATVYETTPKLLNDIDPFFDPQSCMYNPMVNFQNKLRGLEKMLSDISPIDTNVFPSTIECSASL